jgi:hypothetical protein
MITCKAVCACKLALFVLRCVEARSTAVYSCVINLMHTLQSLNGAQAQLRLCQTDLSHCLCFKLAAWWLAVLMP